MTISRRLRALELQSRRDDLTMIVIRGGLTGGDPMYAQIGDERFDREAEETFSAFKDRVEAFARERRCSVCVIGGLPEWEPVGEHPDKCLSQKGLPHIEDITHWKLH